MVKICAVFIMPPFFLDIEIGQKFLHNTSGTVFTKCGQFQNDWYINDKVQEIKRVNPFYGTPLANTKGPIFIK